MPGDDEPTTQEPVHHVKHVVAKTSAKASVAGMLHPAPVPIGQARRRRGLRRKLGQRRPWGTPEERREVIAEYRAFLRDRGDGERGAKKVAIVWVGFDWRTIEGWDEWEE